MKTFLKNISQSLFKESRFVNREGRVPAVPETAPEPDAEKEPAAKEDLAGGASADSITPATDSEIDEKVNEAEGRARALAEKAVEELQKEADVPEKVRAKAMEKNEEKLKAMEEVAKKAKENLRKIDKDDKEAAAKIISGIFKAGLTTEEEYAALMFEGTLTSEADLLKWLKTEGNRNLIRKSIGITGESVVKIDFKALQTDLGLSKAGYKFAVRHLRIGNLLTTAEIKKITEVQTGKGKTLTPQTFVAPGQVDEKGNRIKEGVYTDKFKYIPIFHGAVITFGSGDVLVAADDDFKSKALKKTGERSKAKKAEEAEAADEPASEEKATEEPAAEEAAVEPDVPSRTAGVTPVAVKPLKVETPKPGKTAKLNGVEYEVKGRKHIIHTSKGPKPVTPEVFNQITGQKVPTELAMKETMKEKFPKFGVEPTAISFDADTQKITAMFSEGAAVIMAKYDVVTNKTDIVRAGTTGRLTDLLKDKTPENIAWLDLQVGDIASIEGTDYPEDIKDDMTKAMKKQDSQKVFELLSKQSKPSPAILAWAITRLDISVVDLDVFDALKVNTKGKAWEIIKEMKTLGSRFGSVELYRLEMLNGGDFDNVTVEGIVENIIFTNIEEDFFEKYRSNAKVLEKYLEGPEKMDMTKADGQKQYLVWLQTFGGSTLKDIETLQTCLESLDDLTETDFEDAGEKKPADLEAAKKTIEDKANAIFENWLIANAGKEHEKDGGFTEAYEDVYGADFSETPKSPEVFARYLVTKEETIFTTDAVGKSLAVEKAGPYIDAYINVLTAFPTDVAIEGDARLAKEVYKQAKKNASPKGQIVASRIERSKVLEESKPDHQKRFNSLVKLTKAASTDPYDKQDLVEELRSYLTLFDSEKIDNLGGMAKGKFEEWLNAQELQAKIDAGDALTADELAKIEDPDLKELLEAEDDPKTNITSITQVRRIASVKSASAKRLKAIAETDGLDKTYKIELYLAIGMEGEAKELVGKLKEDDCAKQYYEALATTDKKAKVALLEKAVENIYPRITPSDIQVAIFEAFVAEGTLGDYEKLDTLAGQTPDPDADLDEARAIFRARLVRAQFELWECVDPGQLPDGVGMTPADMPEGVEMGEAKCQPDKLVEELEAYFETLDELVEAKKAKVTTKDYKLLDDLYKSFHRKDKEGKLVRSWKEDLTEDNQKKYSELMLRLAAHTKKSESLEGIDTKKLDSKESQAQLMRLEGGKDFEADMLEAEDLSGDEKIKKLEQALKSAKSNEEKAQVADAFKAMDEAMDEDGEDVAALTRAVEIYLGLGGDYVDEDGNNGIVLAKNTIIAGKGTLDEGRVKGWVDNFAKADYAILAEEICEEYKLYETLLDKVYGKNTTADVQLGKLIKGKVDADKILKFLKDDKRNYTKFLIGASEQAAVDKFVADNKEKLGKLPDTARRKVEVRLGIRQATADEGVLMPKAKAKVAPAGGTAAVVEDAAAKKAEEARLKKEAEEKIEAERLAADAKEAEKKEAEKKAEAKEEERLAAKAEKARLAAEAKEAAEAEKARLAEEAKEAAEAERLRKEGETPDPGNVDGKKAEEGVGEVLGNFLKEADEDLEKPEED